MIKLSQYFDDDTFTIIIDHIAFKSILQTKIKNRRFARLNEWFMFLFKYMFRMNIIHKLNTLYQNVNELFKLTTYNTKIYSIVILITNNDFHQEFREIMFLNFRFDKIYAKIQNQINQIFDNEFEFQIVYQFYRLNSKTKLLCRNFNRNCF